MVSLSRTSSPCHPSIRIISLTKCLLEIHTYSQRIRLESLRVVWDILALVCTALALDCHWHVVEFVLVLGGFEERAEFGVALHLDGVVARPEHDILQDAGPNIGLIDKQIGSNSTHENSENRRVRNDNLSFSVVLLASCSLQGRNLKTLETVQTCASQLKGPFSCRHRRNSPFIVTTLS